ncbi:2'-5' RNA ligase family protein [Agromyces sp. SYSU T00194]|uniref:2'-5' RNA ligase family protein n=1 Tax=Agromyces chitinivorans TaxID=3158560 RepID=UPI003395E114
MGYFVVVLPVERMQVGDEFPVGSWPLHLTAVPPFRTPADADGVAAVLADASEGAPALRVRLGTDAMFGRKHDVPVRLVEDPDGTEMALHERLLDALVRVAAQHDAIDHVGAGHRPHVTHQPDARTEAGDELVLRQLALIDMRPPGGGRRVTWVRELPDG